MLPAEGAGRKLPGRMPDVAAGSPAAARGRGRKAHGSPFPDREAGARLAGERTDRAASPRRPARQRQRPTAPPPCFAPYFVP